MQHDHIDDLVVLGRAAPEPLSDGRYTVCLGGYSETVGYVRLYPTKPEMTECKRWNVISAPVQRAEPEDTRDESYKIAGSGKSRVEALKQVKKVGRLSKSERIRLVDKLAGDCTGRLNETHVSLGMVRPEEIHDFYLKNTPESTIQVTLDGDELKGKRNYPHKLYIEYECDNCSLISPPHQQHCIEWGIYQYWDKYNNPKGVVDALNLTSDDWFHYFFVGNLNHQRRAYIIISDLRFKKEDMINAGVLVDGQKSLGQY